MNNTINPNEQSSRHDYSTPNNSQPENIVNPSSTESEQRNRLHSDRVNAREHSLKQDETQYTKTHEEETTLGKVERKTEEMKDNVKEGFNKAKDKVNEWGNQVKDKINEWSDNSDSKLEDAHRKMDKAQKKMDKAQDKIDKAQDKIDNAYENLKNHENRSTKHPQNPQI